MSSIYKSIGVYRITNTINGKSYIGKTKMNFGDRWDNHKTLLRYNKHSNHNLQADWNEYGENAFEFAVLEEVKDSSVLNELETKYIRIYRERGLCYNIQDGGDSSWALGKHLSDETKRKIGEKNRANMLGRHATDETKKRMSDSQRARYVNWTDDDRRAYGKRMSEIASGYHWNEEAKLRFSKRQQTNPNAAKYTVDDIHSIRDKFSNGATYEELAIEYRTTKAYIQSIIARRRWANV